MTHISRFRAVLTAGLLALVLGTGFLAMSDPVAAQGHGYGHARGHGYGRHGGHGRSFGGHGGYGSHGY